MDEEVYWQRIAEAARVISTAHNVPLPEALERVSGDAWERNKKRRAALVQFLTHIPTVPDEIPDHLDMLADLLDELALQEMDE